MDYMMGNKLFIFPFYYNFSQAFWNFLIDNIIISNFQSKQFWGMIMNVLCVKFHSFQHVKKLHKGLGKWGQQLTKIWSKSWVGILRYEVSFRIIYPHSQIFWVMSVQSCWLKYFFQITLCGTFPCSSNKNIFKYKELFFLRKYFSTLKSLFQ